MLNGSATLKGSSISSNMATLEGGVLHTALASLTIQGSTFADNSAGMSGGCLHAAAAADGGATKLLITNTTITNNSAGASGGFAYAAGLSVLKTIGTSFINISAGRDGGVFALCFSKVAGPDWSASLQNRQMLQQVTDRVVGATMQLTSPPFFVYMLNTNLTGNSAGKLSNPNQRVFASPHLSFQVCRYTPFLHVLQAAMVA